MNFGSLRYSSIGLQVNPGSQCIYVDLTRRQVSATCMCPWMLISACLDRTTCKPCHERRDMSRRRKFIVSCCIIINDFGDLTLRRNCDSRMWCQDGVVVDNVLFPVPRTTARVVGVATHWPSCGPSTEPWGRCYTYPVIPRCQWRGSFNLPGHPHLSPKFWYMME